MAKKQTRRSISVSRVTYERLKAFCEGNGISMSQFVESRVGDFLGGDGDEVTLSVADPSRAEAPRPSAPVGLGPSIPRPIAPPTAARPVAPASASASASAPRPAAPITSAAARFAVEPPPPIIRPRQDQPAPPVVARTADQIFTF